MGERSVGVYWLPTPLSEEDCQEIEALLGDEEIKKKLQDTNIQWVVGQVNYNFEDRIEVALLASARKIPSDKLKGAEDYYLLEFLYENFQLFEDLQEEVFVRLCELRKQNNLLLLLPNSRSSSSVWKDRGDFYVFPHAQFPEVPVPRDWSCLVHPKIVEKVLLQLHDADCFELGALSDLGTIHKLSGADDSKRYDVSHLETADFFESLKAFKKRGAKKVIIYYSGHGNNDGKGKFPEIRFKDKPLTKGDLDAAIKEHQFNAVVVLDCCNNIKMQTVAYRNTEEGTNVLQKLWDFEGALFVVGCSPGEKASCTSTTGGNFSNLLFQILEKHEGDWEQAVQHLPEDFEDTKPWFSN